jgi:hypothetical protein
MLLRNGNIQWNMFFTRPLPYWEVDLVSSFFEMYSLKVRQGDVDKICWIPSKKSKFKVRSYYHVLTIPTGFPFPWRGIWRVKAHSRVVFFMWSMALGKILILNNLRKMNVIVVDCCCMSKKSEEFIDHLFLHCEVARNLWNLLLNLFGVVWVMPRRVSELLVSWGG